MVVLAARFVLCFAVLCALLFLACYVGTGSDERNMRSINSYPEAVRGLAMGDPQLTVMAPPVRSRGTAFVANLVVFAVALFLVGLIVRPGGFLLTLLGLLAVGEGLNLFDLLVIDALWWRNSPRVRLTGIDDPALYRDMRPHVAAFARGVAMFALAALIASVAVCALPL